MAVKKMFAKFAGKCAKCGGHFPAGTPIGYDTEARKAAHAACPAVPAPAPKFEMVPAAAFEAELAAAAAVAAEKKAAMEAAREAYEGAIPACRVCNGTGRYSVHVHSDNVWLDDGLRNCSNEGCAAKGSREEWEKKPEVAALRKAFWAAEVEANAAKRAVEAAKEKLVPVKGAEVEVFKGRKVAKGTKGFVNWVGYSEGYGKVAERVGIKDAEGNVHFTAAANVKVLAVPMKVEAAPVAMAA